MQISKFKGSPANRRSFLQKSLTAGTATIGAGLLSSALPAMAQDPDDSGVLSRGDAAILRFLAAAEQIEADLWIQYNELGGVSAKDTSVGGLAPAYVNGLQQLDADMPQYIGDNTDDEISHYNFLNHYLRSKGADPIDLSNFATIPPSNVTGVPAEGRLTNLMELTVDTSWWTKYRSDSKNPDIGSPSFEQAVPDLAAGRFPAIPRNNDDLYPTASDPMNLHIQAIANTAGFHFCFIEQGGTSLYPSLAQKVTNLEVLRILLSIGPTEAMHFQTWHDKAGNAVPLTDPRAAKLTFPNLNQGPKFGGEKFQTNLIMPEPTVFLNGGPKFPCSVVRPTNRHGAAMGAAKALIGDGLFRGQTNPQFFAMLRDLASDADAAKRDCD